MISVQYYECYCTLLGGGALFQDTLYISAYIESMLRWSCIKWRRNEDVVRLSSLVMYRKLLQISPQNGWMDSQKSRYSQSSKYVVAGFILKERKKNAELRELLGLEPVSSVIKKGRFIEVVWTRGTQ